MELTRRDGKPSILLDEANRSAHKTENDSGNPIERINVKMAGGEPMDIRQRSRIVASIDDFKLTRAYVDRDHQNAHKIVCDAIEREIGNA